MRLLHRSFPRSRASVASVFLRTCLFDTAPEIVNVSVAAVYLSTVYGLVVGAVVLGTGACYAMVMLKTRPMQAAYRTKVSTEKTL